MELTEKQVTTSAKEWIARAGRRLPYKSDYSLELKSWLQRAISDAEKNGNFQKKDQLLTLLDDL
jgi:hypothetical protein